MRRGPRSGGESWSDVRWPEPWRTARSGRARWTGSWARSRHRADLEPLLRQVPTILDRVPAEALHGLVGPLQIRTVGVTSTSSVVLTVGDEVHDHILVKFPRSPKAQTAARREQGVLIELRGDLDGEGILSLLPVPLGSGVVADQEYHMQKFIPGQPATVLLDADPSYLLRTMRETAGVIARLHRATRQEQVIDETLFSRWVEEPAEVIERVLRRRKAANRWGRALRDVVAELRTSLVGSEAPTGWVHGDLWLGNLLVGPEDRSTLVGVVDWDRASNTGLPRLDLLHLVIFTRSLTERMELGAAVRGVLAGRPWSASERTLFSVMNDAEGRARPVERSDVLLYWLRQVALELGDRPDNGFAYIRNPHFLLWEINNITKVLGMIRTDEPKQ